MFGFGTPAAPAPATTATPGGGFGSGFKGFDATTPAPAPTPGGALTAWGSTTTTTTTTGAPAAPAAPDSNLPVSGETSFAQLPQAMQQKIFQAHWLIMEHRRHAEGVGKFSTQDSGLEQHTKKLKLDILRVQNAHSELALAAGELRKQVEWLRGHIQKLQAAESGLPQYPSGGAGAGGRGGGGSSAELWQQQQQDSHAEILREMVGQFEARLSQYDAHIQDLYRKVVSAHGGGAGAAGGGERRGGGEGQVTPDQLAVLIRLQNDALLKVAAQVAGVHEMVERVRSEWTSRAGSDLFEELDRMAEEEEERKRKAARLVVPSSSSAMGAAPIQGSMSHVGGAPLALTAGGGMAGAGTPGGLFGGQAGGTPQQAAPVGAAGGFSAFGTQSVGFFGQSNPDAARQTRNKRSTRR